MTVLIDKSTIPDFDSWVIATTGGGERWIGFHYHPGFSEYIHLLPGYIILKPAYTVVGQWVGGGDPKAPSIAGKTFAVVPIEWIPSVTEVEILPTSIIRMSTLSDADKKRFMTSVNQAKELAQQMSAAQSGLVLPTAGQGLIK